MMPTTKILTTWFHSRLSLSLATPELASKKFQNVDVHLLLDTLNKLFNTNIPISYPGIEKTPEYLINKGHDLGAVYGHMQVIWHNGQRQACRQYRLSPLLTITL